MDSENLTLMSETVVDTETAVEDGIDIPWSLAVETVSFGLLWLLAVSGNVLITCTLLRRGLLAPPSNRLVFSVTLSNLIFSFCVFPCILVSAIKKQWIFGSVWCYMNGFFTVLVVVASSSTLAVIALDRYYAIVKPMQYSRTMTGSRANLLLLLAWLLGLSCALPPCFGWSSYAFEPSYRACFFNWSASVSYSLVLLVVTVLFPLISMVICYYAILQVACTKCKRINVGTMADPMTPLEKIQTLAAAPADIPLPVRNSTYSETTTNDVAEESPPATAKSLRRNRFSFSSRKPSFSWISSTSSINSNAPVKGMRTVFFVVAAFLLTWIPMVVLALLEICCHFLDVPVLQPPSWLYVFAMWSLCAGSVTYPILYGIYNRAIRKHLKSCLHCTPRYAARNQQFAQRRGSRWSNLSEYAALRPRENSAPLVTTPPQKTGTEESARETGNQVRKPSQDSGAVIPAKDEEDSQEQNSLKQMLRSNLLKHRAAVQLKSIHGNNMAVSVMIPYLERNNSGRKTYRQPCNTNLMRISSKWTELSLNVRKLSVDEGIEEDQPQ